MQMEFSPIPEVLNFSTSDWEAITEEGFKKIFQNSPLKRAKLNGIRRNLKFIQNTSEIFNNKFRITSQASKYVQISSDFFPLRLSKFLYITTKNNEKHRIWENRIVKINLFYTSLQRSQTCYNIVLIPFSRLKIFIYKENK